MLIISNSSNSFCFLSYCTVASSILSSTPCPQSLHPVYGLDTMTTMTTKCTNERYACEKEIACLFEKHSLIFLCFPMFPRTLLYTPSINLNFCSPPITKFTVCPHRTLQHCTIIHFRCPWYFDPFSHTIAPTIAPTTTTNQLSNRGW